MGTASEGSSGGAGGDWSVGTIVWVRRRNGSWWPGRVLGPEELAESHLMSPRSGTPVKLLGRDDASVDWYNLEKSKRVKLFRCGEFGSFIERAEASNSIPIKKREKYARREDAILHALELEKQQLEIKQQSTANSGCASTTAIAISEKESSTYFSEDHVSSKLANQKSQLFSRTMPASLNEYCSEQPVPSSRNKKVKPKNREDGKHEIVTHHGEGNMNPEIGNSEGNALVTVDHKNVDIPDENMCNFLPDGGHNHGFMDETESVKNFSFLKRKAVPVGGVNDSPAKRRDRRRKLVKVLQSSAKQSVSYPFDPHSCSPVNQMCGVDDQIGISHIAHQSPDSDDTLNISRQPLEYSPVDTGSGDHTQQLISNESTQSTWTEENDFDSSATDSDIELGEERLRSGGANFFKQLAENSIDNGISRWHLKGKRKTRIITKKVHEYGDRKNLSGTEWFNRESSRDGKPTSRNIDIFEPAELNAQGQGLPCEGKQDYDNKEEDLFPGLGNMADDLERHQSDVDSDDDLQLKSQSGWVDVDPSFKNWRTCWEESADHLDQFYASLFRCRLMPMLVDVDLKVQARYRGVHVPLISLTSKLNDKAIVGHQVQVEVLSDGTTDLLLLTNEATLDGDGAPPSIWRTAKRTSMHRLPRSNPDPANCSYLERKPLLERPLLQAKKKNVYHRSASGKFQKKALKTVSLSSSQKTRTLSSFTAEGKLEGSAILGGLIKTDGSMPLVACVPVKVVFSRILESVGRPSSAAAHRAIAANAIDKGPP